MLEVKNLSITVSNKKLIDNLSFVVNKRDKLAIIGEEGNGKSTLLKAIMGCLDYGEIKGSIITQQTLGYFVIQLFYC